MFFMVWQDGRYTNVFFTDELFNEECIMKPKAASLLDVINSPVFTVGLEHVRYRIFYIK